MPSGSLAVNWPVPTGLGYIKKNTAISIKAIFSWDKITDASLTISAISVVGSLDAKGVAKKGIKTIIRNFLILNINNYWVSISSQSSSFMVSVISSEFWIFLFLSCKYKLLTDA